MSPRPQNNQHHPDRDQIMRAVETGKVPFADHLKSCEACRDLYELARMYRDANGFTWPTPSDRQIERHAALPFLIGNWTSENATEGRVSLDSWKDLPASAIRDSAQGLERRLRLAAGPVELELVGERTLGGWRFVARCYREGSVTGEFVLKVGRRRMQAGRYECFRWTSDQPPRSVQLLSPSLEVVFDNIKW
jgi:hypothetical protein